MKIFICAQFFTLWVIYNIQDKNLFFKKIKLLPIKSTLIKWFLIISNKISRAFSFSKNVSESD